MTGGTMQEPRQARVVIPGLPAVSPLGLSGHYHLPERGFHLAVEAGIGLFFFEPNYASMGRFVRSLPPSQRSRLQLTGGTFAADPKKILKDIERLLRLLRRERIELFLMFWTRSWTRISDEAIEVLEAARASGKIHTFSLSTHNLSLAAEAIDRGYDPVMVRHNAAHHRAETEVLPQAVRQARRVVLFNTTCYGRLLGPRPDAPDAPSAADCLRYGVSQEGAAACWTAPATIDQLTENLQVLDDPELPAERLEHLLKRAARIREMDRAVRENLRDRE
jgi:aryl-alcohol dehydrogenase-like predicted oxidoreductase